MTYIQHYDAPLGRILLAADEIGLTGLWFDGAKYFADGLPDEHTERETPVLSEARRWLDLYFAGREPGFLPPLHPAGSTFQQEVWALLLQIPYGQTVTYGELARQLAEKQGRPRMSAQAVGGAVGHNKISIIIPCHRVVGILTEGRGTPAVARALVRSFEQRCGATICKELKGVATGVPLCPCPECVRNAVLALGDVLPDAVKE